MSGSSATPTPAATKPEDRGVVVVLERDLRLEAGGVAGAQEQPRVGAGGGAWRASTARRRSPPGAAARRRPAGDRAAARRTSGRRTAAPPRCRRARARRGSWLSARSSSPLRMRGQRLRRVGHHDRQLDRRVALAEAGHRERHDRRRGRGERREAAAGRPRARRSPAARPRRPGGWRGSPRPARASTAPASVSTAPCGTRRTSSAPTSASSVAIWRETAGWVYPSASAAAENEPRRATSQSTRRRRLSSMT